VTESNASSKPRILVGVVLLVVGLAVFAVRLQHAGAYAVPRGGSLFGGVGSLLLGGMLLWPALPRVVAWVVLAASPVVFFLAIYSTMGELEEVVSLYATDSARRAAELRLWIVDREDGEWVGMSRGKALEHSLDGARLELLRAGETRCVVPVLHEDRPTARAIHAMKVEKYAVARAAAAIGLYPREATESTAVLRLDPCPGG
jgi:hypothetical protein